MTESETVALGSEEGEVGVRSQAAREWGLEGWRRRGLEATWGLEGDGGDS